MLPSRFGHVEEYVYNLDHKLHYVFVRDGHDLIVHVCSGIHGPNISFVAHACNVT